MTPLKIKNKKIPLKPRNGPQKATNYPEILILLPPLRGEWHISHAYVGPVLAKPQN